MYILVHPVVVNKFILNLVCTNSKNMETLCQHCGEKIRCLNFIPILIYLGVDYIPSFVLNLQQESGGTVLSTNWKDIEKQKTECKPPDGMEFKKWEY